VKAAKIILFDSYAYGMPWEESDIDIYVVLKDGSKNPLLAMEDVYSVLRDRSCYACQL
jgi:predicted nucleotidyltransferase